uniref:Uncharacterized protein n=1 Tax=Avena sativa TaxID=4498 RepID=A0ACD5V0L2_AVESA
MASSLERSGSRSSSVAVLIHGDLEKEDRGGEKEEGERSRGVWGVWVHVLSCRRRRYQIGSIGGLVGCNQRVFLELKEELIGERLRFFKSLGLAEEAGRFVLSNPGVFDLDFDDVVISVPEYLRRVGLLDDEVDAAVKLHPFVVGRNRLKNLPGVLRAMGLNHRFLEKISGGGESLRYLSPDFVLEDASYDLEVERAFLDRMIKVKVEKNSQLVDAKLEFLKSIGYGENKIATHVIPVLHSTQEMLRERFDYLLERGVEYTMLCRIVSVFPKLGYSLEYLDCFPALLCFDLENRVKPRYAMLRWLQEYGLLKRTLAPATVLANSEKKFISNLYNLHPAAPKLWLECFSSRIHMECYLKNIQHQHPDNIELYWHDYGSQRYRGLPSFPSRRYY